MSEGNIQSAINEQDPENATTDIEKSAQEEEEPPSENDAEQQPQQEQHVQYSAFTINQKRTIVAMGSLASFFSPLSSSIYFPALETIATALGVSITKINLTVTTYLVSPFLLYDHFSF
jgi:hypothetical protein